MAGRSSKKENDNFEKLKREMKAKQQKAKKQVTPEPSQQISEYPEPEMCSFNMDETGPSLCNTLITPEQYSLEDQNDHVNDMKISEELLNEVQQKESMVLLEEQSKIQMVIFRIGEEEYALEISIVKEIVRIPPMNHVPNSPDYIAGLCSLRGELLPVINSHKLFRIADVGGGEGSRIVVTDIDGKKVGLIADKVSEVISVEKSVINDPPESIRGMDGGAVKGVLLLNAGKRVIMVLDAIKIVKVGNFKECSNLQINKDRCNLDLKDDLVEEQQVILFSVGTEEYAFELQMVKEIIRLPEITKVPNSSSYIEGMLSIRKQLIAVINLGVLLGNSETNINEQSRIVILETKNVAFGVIVDKVSQVKKVQNNEFRNTRLDTKTSGIEYIKGFLELDNGKRLAMVLDPIKLILLEEVNMALTKDKKNITDSLTPDSGRSEEVLEHAVIFNLGSEEFGLSIHYVKEINRVTEIYHFPGAPIFIDGMVNLRGDVIPVLNLKTLFKRNSVLSDSSKFLVVEYENKKIGILIDSASEVLRISKEQIEEASDVIKVNENNSYIDGIAKLNQGNRIVLLLNLSAVLSFT